MTETTAPAHIRQRFAAKLAAAQQITVTATETVTAGDIKVGDVIAAIGSATFHPPITISQVRPTPRRKTVVLVSRDGWFSMTPIAATDTAVRAR